MELFECEGPIPSSSIGKQEINFSPGKHKDAPVTCYFLFCWDAESHTSIICEHIYLSVGYIKKVIKLYILSLVSSWEMEGCTCNRLIK